MNEVSSSESPLLVGRYRLDTFLGEGGQAVVVKVHDTRLGVPRALKVLLPSCARKPKLRARFESEAQTMAVIDHPNVVRVFDVDTAGSVPYFVMEYVVGGSLADRVDQGPLPPRLAATAVIQVCRGLAAAHELGVVHRDVKPHNVLVNPHGTCKVMDFGIARMGDSRHKTRQGAAIGTHGYMAPEQATDAASVDLRSDLYGVGMTTYVLLTGRDPIEWLSGAYTNVVEPLRAIITRATATRKEDRYANALEFAAALEAAMADLPADPPGATVALSGNRPPVTEDDQERLVEVIGWFTSSIGDDSSSLGGSAEAATPVGMAPASPSLVPTPYTMSRPTPRARGSAAPEVQPEWLPAEQHPPKVGPGGFTVALDDEARQATANAAARRAETPAPTATVPTLAEPVVTPTSDRDPVSDLGWGIKVIVAAGVPALLVAIVVVLALLGWRTRVQREEERVRTVATEQLVGAVKHQLPLVGTLESLGSDRATLEVLVNDFQNAPDPATKALAAIRLTDHVDAELHRLVDPNSAQWQTLGGPLEELKDATHDYRVAVGELPPDPEPPAP